MNKQILQHYNQLHLMAHYNSLKPDQKEIFEREIECVDFATIDRLYRDLVGGDDTPLTEVDALPIPPKQPTQSESLHFKTIGRQALKNDDVAVLLLAGGQGSRLGHDGPKGTYDIGAVGGKSLFELHANYMLCLHRQYDIYLPWLIMTSAINHQATIAFFEANGYFGYPREQITFFEQGMIEAVDHDGKIIIESATSISRSPDGNGGCFKALRENGLVDMLIEKGYKWLYVFNVDNAIVNIADPEFIGFTLERGAPCSALVVAKDDPDEKVGIPCKVAGKPTIVEYSELSEDKRYARNLAGNLVFSGGNIGNYCLKLDTLQAYLSQPLHYHLAHKKIAYLADDGQVVKPKEPNGYKFELFIFDIFPAFSDMAVLEVARRDAFAPVKNATGVDSPETARRLYDDKHARRAGVICE